MSRLNKKNPLVGQARGVAHSQLREPLIFQNSSAGVGTAAFCIDAVSQVAEVSKGRSLHLSG
jgi:hypothetical protein